MSNEPKNPYVLGKIRIEDANHYGWMECEETYLKYLRSLVGEKGREEIATILRAYRLHVTELNSRKEQPLFNKAVDALADLEEALDSLLPIIGSMVKEREEELRKEGRQEVVEWVNKAYPIIKIYPNWQAQLKLWGVQKEGTKNE